MKKEIPPEILDLVRFLADVWSMTEENRIKAMSVEPEMVKTILALEWPVVQGMKNQKNLKRISGQKYSRDKLNKAVEYMLNQAV